MYKGSIEPLYVVVLREGEQDLTADNGEGEQQDSSPRHSQGEGTQVQPTEGARETSRYTISVSPICIQQWLSATAKKIKKINTGTQIQPSVGGWVPVIYPIILNRHTLLHHITARVKVNRNNLQVALDIKQVILYIALYAEPWLRSDYRLYHVAGMGICKNIIG